MGNTQPFQDFVANQSVQISTPQFVINLLLAAILSYILREVYIRYGTVISNRRAFAQNFIVITLTTMFIITVVKSSLALSLGLVGALSIVRFRTAIKEPEELSYLFLAIAIGLGLGADQQIITILAVVFILAVILVKQRTRTPSQAPNLHLIVSRPNPQESDLQEIVKILNQQCLEINLKRVDTSSDILEASFLVVFAGFNELEATKLALQKLDPAIRITFLDNKGIGGIG